MAALEWMIPGDVKPMRLDKYLLRVLPGVPAWAVREAFSRRDVKMDGLRVGAEELAKPGARVTVYGIRVQKARLDVVYEDENILLINKPAGISVQADDGGGATVEDLALAHVRLNDPEVPAPKACHRLDNQTCGLLLLAKTEAAQTLYLTAFKERTVKKTYVCLVKGTPEPESAVLHAYLLKDAKAARVKVSDASVPGALPIATGYRVVEKGPVSRLEVDLITGRTHQIRAQLAHIGHPVLGDDAYGDRALNREQGAKRLMLCAVSLTLPDGRGFSVLPPF